MTQDGQEEKHVLRPGAVRKLLEDGGEELTDDQRALLMALIGVEAESLDEEEQAALDRLKEQIEGYDAEDLSQAVEHMVKAKPQRSRQVEWPELKQKLLRRRSSKK